jgi:uncharacterized protein YbjT (DUF2867 family)
MLGLATVFGGSGFLGRYSVRALAKDGWRIRVVMRRPHLAPELRVMGDVGQIELMQGNLRHPDSIAEALEGADAAVNLVGLLYEAGRQRFDARPPRQAPRGSFRSPPSAPTPPPKPITPGRRPRVRRRFATLFRAL